MGSLPPKYEWPILPVMRISSLCLLLFTATIQAQPAPGTDFVSRLNSDLMPLKSLPPLTGSLENRAYGMYISGGPSVKRDRDTLDKDFLAARQALLVSPDQGPIIQRYEDDFSKFESQRRSERKPADFGIVQRFFTWDQAYKLTSALAGKDLSETGLTQLTQAILGMVDSALACRSSSSLLRDSAQFRDYAEQAYAALHALGVSHENALVVMDVFLENSVKVAAPPISYR